MLKLSMNDAGFSVILVEWAVVSWAWFSLDEIGSIELDSFWAKMNMHLCEIYCSFIVLISAVVKFAIFALF